MRHRKGGILCGYAFFLAVAFSKSYCENSFQGLDFEITAKDGDRT